MPYRFRFLARSSRASCSPSPDGCPDQGRDVVWTLAYPSASSRYSPPWMGELHPPGNRVRSSIDVPPLHYSSVAPFPVTPICTLNEMETMTGRHPQCTPRLSSNPHHRLRSDGSRPGSRHTDAQMACRPPLHYDRSYADRVPLRLKTGEPMTDRSPFTPAWTDPRSRHQSLQLGHASCPAEGVQSERAHWNGGLRGRSGFMWGSEDRLPFDGRPISDWKR